AISTCASQILGVIDRSLHGGRNIVTFILVQVLSRPHRKCRAAGRVERGRSRDDAVEIIGELLRCFEALPAARGATLEIRQSRIVAIEGGEHGFSFYCRFMHSSISIVV